MSLVPGGGTVHELLQARGIEIAKERTRCFFEELGAGTIALTEELIASEDFLHCYFKTLKAAQHTRQKEKVQLLAKLLCGAISSTAPDFDQYEEFLDTLDQMSLREITALQLLRRHEVASKTSVWKTEASQISSYWQTFKEEVCDELGLEAEEFDPFVARLVRTGFYRENNESFYDDKVA